jgi:hypothetical protein
MLLYNRQKAQAYQSTIDKGSNTFLYKVLSNRWLMNRFGGGLKTKLLSLVKNKFIGKKKTLAPFTSKTFNEQWKKHIKR